jgi:hypothetical protein
VVRGGRSGCRTLGVKRSSLERKWVLEA